MNNVIKSFLIVSLYFAPLSGQDTSPEESTHEQTTERPPTIFQRISQKISEKKKYVVAATVPLAIALIMYLRSGNNSPLQSGRKEGATKKGIPTLSFVPADAAQKVVIKTGMADIMISPAMVNESPHLRLGSKFAEGAQGVYDFESFYKQNGLPLPSAQIWKNIFTIVAEICRYKGQKISEVDAHKKHKDEGSLDPDEPVGAHLVDAQDAKKMANERFNKNDAAFLHLFAFVGKMNIPLDDLREMLITSSFFNLSDMLLPVVARAFLQKLAKEIKLLIKTPDYSEFRTGLKLAKNDIAFIKSYIELPEECIDAREALANQYAMMTGEKGILDKLLKALKEKLEAKPAAAKTFKEKKALKILRLLRI